MLCVCIQKDTVSVWCVFFSFLCVDNQTGYIKDISDENNFKTYLIFMIIIVYQVAKMMERTQTLPDRIDRNVQE